VAEARTLANQAAEKIAERFANGQLPRDRYGYPDRPLREPVLREYRGVNGELTAAITRNSYGCRVLNAASLMIVDVDFPEQKRGPGFIARLFGAKAPATFLGEDRALASAKSWIEGNAGWGWRVYRTRAGLRLLATHAPIDPESETTNRVFEALGADPLYHRLCRIQKCFRARLTPKPWRCGMAQPPVRWPWANARAESRFTKWEKQYLATCTAWATCDLLTALGEPCCHSEVEPLIKAHDEATRAGSKLPLA
jgi:hypothetical protein